MVLKIFKPSANLLSVLLVMSIFLTCPGQSYARPVLDVYGSEENNTVYIGNPDQDKQELPVIPLQWSRDDNSQFEIRENPDSMVQERSRQTGKAGALQDDENAVTVSTDNENNRKTTDNGRSTRKARNANGCIERYLYHIIYNRVFRIPVCKAGCKSKYKSVTFSNGQTVAIRYDCYK